jgi:putative membrane protein
MANDRTLLAFLRTSLTFCAAGIGLIKFLDHPVFGVIGWLFIVLAGISLIWGIYRYRHVKKVLRMVTPQDQQTAEKEMGL